MHQNLIPPPAQEYPCPWMQTFLEVYARSGHLAGSAWILSLTVKHVRFRLHRHPEFAAAFAQAQAIVAERIWKGCKHRVPGFH